jgi:hypothetical protein
MDEVHKPSNLNETACIYPHFETILKSRSQSSSCRIPFVLLNTQPFQSTAYVVLWDAQRAFTSVPTKLTIFQPTPFVMSCSPEPLLSLLLLSFPSGSVYKIQDTAFWALRLRTGMLAISFRLTWVSKTILGCLQPPIRASLSKCRLPKWVIFSSQRLGAPNSAYQAVLGC